MNEWASSPALDQCARLAKYMYTITSTSRRFLTRVVLTRPNFDSQESRLCNHCAHVNVYHNVIHYSCLLLVANRAMSVVSMMSAVSIHTSSSTTPVTRGAPIIG